jgi:hypothetical protein
MQDRPAAALHAVELRRDRESSRFVCFANSQRMSDRGFAPLFPGIFTGICEPPSEGRTSLRVSSKSEILPWCGTRTSAEVAMLRLLSLVAVPLIAGAVIAQTTVPARAFTQQTLTPNGNYDFNYGPLDDKNKSGDSSNKSDPNSPGFHFDVQHGESNGFHSFGSNRNTSPPDPYFHTFGN